MSPDPHSPDLTRQPLRFLAAYWTAWQGLSGQVQAALAREHDLDLRAFLILSHVQAGPHTPSDLARTLDLQDNATPSANGLAADALLRLADLTGEARHREAALGALRLSASVAVEHPLSFAQDRKSTRLNSSHRT